MEKLNTRTKKMAVNSIAGGLLAIITMITGFLLPRFIIQSYGSEINGLSVSVRQFVNYLSYIELGVYPMFFSALFKPLASNDTKRINGIVNEAKKTYYKLSLVYLIILIVGVAVFPFVINRGEIPILKIVLITAIYGVSGLLNLFVLSRYRVLFSADQKLYLIKIFDIAQNIVTTALQIIAIIFKVDILIVLAIPIPFSLLKGLYFNYVQKKKYPYIDYRTYEKVEIEIKRKDAFIFEFATSLEGSLPILALSILATLNDVNVYSIYNLVFLGLGSIISMFTGGSTASFGNLLAEKNEGKTQKAYKDFYVLLNTLAVVLFGTTLFLMIPFIKLYLKDVDNVSVYINAAFPILFAVCYYFSNMTIPQLNVIRASGKYKEGKYINIISLLIKIVLVFSLTYFFNIAGALAGLIIGYIVKFIILTIFVEKKIVPKTLLFSFMNLILALVIIFHTYYFVVSLFTIVIDSVISFILYGVLFVATYSVISVASNILLNRKEIESLGRRIAALFRKK